MTTVIIAWVLVSLTSGLSVQVFKGEDNAECIQASYRYALLTGQEFRCLPKRVVVR